MYCGHPVPMGDERTEPVISISRRVHRKRNEADQTYSVPEYSGSAEPSYNNAALYYEQPYEYPVRQEPAYRLPYSDEPIYREGRYGAAEYRDPLYNEHHRRERSYRAPSNTEYRSYRASEYNDSIYYAYNDGYYDDCCGYGGYVTDAGYEGRYGSDYSGKNKTAYDFSVINDDGSLNLAKCLLYFLCLDVAALIILLVLGLVL